MMLSTVNILAQLNDRIRYKVAPTNVSAKSSLSLARGTEKPPHMSGFSCPYLTNGF